MKIADMKAFIDGEPSLFSARRNRDYETMANAVNAAHPSAKATLDQVKAACEYVAPAAPDAPAA